MEIYHGCENIFIITEDKSFLTKKQEVISLCAKYQTDGLIIFLKDPYEMVLFNADGSLATMCGNGLRAYVKYGVDHHLIVDNKLKVKTLAGLIHVEIINKEPFLAKVNLGKASYLAKKLNIKTAKEEYFGEEEIIDGITYQQYAIWTGTDNLVIIVNNFKDIENLAQIFSKKTIFQVGINVNFMKINSPANIEVRTYERGVGWTRACGTGSAACVSVGRRLGRLLDKVEVSLLGGSLLIELLDNSIYMSGPAVRVKQIS